MRRHLEIVREFGLNPVVAVNRFPGDTDDEVERRAPARARARRLRGRGQRRLHPGRRGRGRAGRDRRRRGRRADGFRLRSTRSTRRSRTKIEAIAKRVYGADGVFLQPAARAKVKEFTKLGSTAADLHGEDAPLALARPDARECADRIHGAACATCAPTPARAGSSRSAATCRRCPASAATPAAMTSTSTSSGRDRRPLLSSAGTAPSPSSGPRASGRSSAATPTKVIGTPDADLSRAELREQDGLRRRRARRLVRGLARRGVRRHGPLGLGQVDARAHADPADRADRRRDRDRRPGRHGGRHAPSCAAAARHRRRWSSSTSGCSPTGA